MYIYIYIYTCTRARARTHTQTHTHTGSLEANNLHVQQDHKPRKQPEAILEQRNSTQRASPFRGRAHAQCHAALDDVVHACMSVCMHVYFMVKF